MLLPIKPICCSNKVRRDGTSLIFIQYCLNADSKTLLNTEIAIPPSYWHKKLERISGSLPHEYGIADELNKELRRLIRLAEDIIAFAIERNFTDPVTFAKATFKPTFDVTELNNAGKEKPVGRQKVNIDFFYQFDDYVRSKQNQVAPSTLHVFRNLKTILHSFETFRKKDITFSCIDSNFYDDFLHYLTFEHVHLNRKEITKGFKRNTVGKNIKQLIVFLKNRKQKKVISELDLSGFKILDEEADAIYLTKEELKNIFQLNLSALPRLLKYRDLLVFGCLTGLRFSDFSLIRSEDVRDGMIFKKQVKTKHWVVIPLRDEASYIFHNCFKSNIPKVSNPDFNYNIKEVGKLAGIVQPVKHSYIKGNKNFIEIKPKYEWITSHTCRRSFCTNEFLAGTPVELIMKISGHKSLKDFYKYIKIAPEHAGHRIREIWQHRGEIDTTPHQIVRDY
ncbi:MAG: site-specific integrase [Bacteroidota bacterium]|nr:site-specific integrase [Bacteroidota bacterium]